MHIDLFLIFEGKVRRQLICNDSKKEKQSRKEDKLVF